MSISGQFPSPAKTRPARSLCACLSAALVRGGAVFHRKGSCDVLFHPRLRVFPNGATRWRGRRRTQGCRARSGGVSPLAAMHSRTSIALTVCFNALAPRVRVVVRDTKTARGVIRKKKDSKMEIEEKRREDRSASCLKRRNVSALLFNGGANEAREVHDAYATGLRSHQ